MPPLVPLLMEVHCLIYKVGGRGGGTVCKESHEIQPNESVIQMVQAYENLLGRGVVYARL